MAKKSSERLKAKTGRAKKSKVARKSIRKVMATKKKKKKVMAVKPATATTITTTPTMDQTAPEMM